MKKLYILLIILTSLNSFSQSENNQVGQNYNDTFPIYKGCEKEKDFKKCFSKKINSHFSTKFRSSKFQNLKPRLKRVYIIFRVNEIGEIDSVKIRAPQKKIELEAKRVLNLVPKFIPGTQNNQPIAVKYTLPIVFRVEKKKPTMPHKKTRKTPWSKN